MGGSPLASPLYSRMSWGGARPGMEERDSGHSTRFRPKGQGQLRGRGPGEERAAVSWVGQAQIRLRSQQAEVENQHQSGSSGGQKSEPSFWKGGSMGDLGDKGNGAGAPATWAGPGKEAG